MITQTIKAKDIKSGVVLVSSLDPTVTVLVDAVMDEGGYVLLFVDTGDCWEVGAEQEGLELI